MTYKFRNSVAQNLVYFRYQNQWTQETLAEKINSSSTYISQLENERRNIRIDFLEKIATVFKVEPHELLIPRNIQQIKHIKNRVNV